MPTDFAITMAAKAWAAPETSGVEFDSRLAMAFANIVDEVRREASSHAWLGNATTGDLLDEVSARVDRSYRTVGGEAGRTERLGNQAEVVLRQIVADLPAHRDWLNPALEAEAREILRRCQRFAGREPTSQLNFLEGQVRQFIWERGGAGRAVLQQDHGIAEVAAPGEEV